MISCSLPTNKYAITFVLFICVIGTAEIFVAYYQNSALVVTVVRWSILNLDNNNNNNNNNNDRPIIFNNKEAAFLKQPKKNLSENLHRVTPPPKRSTIHLAVVVCDWSNRVEEALVLLKSATLLTIAPLHAHIFGDNKTIPEIKKELDKWPEFIRRKFSYDFNNVTYPPQLNLTEWRTLFKPCATQRLFFPDLLKNVDSILYMDTDTLFLRPVDDVWAFFNEFNTSQIAAFAPESEGSKESWYGHASRTPYVLPLGVNSGVMLMNLTRMRERNWVKVILDYYEKYKSKVILGDQDLINTYFYFNFDRYYLFPCNWNYRPDHCMYEDKGMICKSALTLGASILHGSRSYFHYDAEAMFRAVYDGIREHKFGESLRDILLPKVINKIKTYRQTRCSNQSHVMTIEFVRQIYLNHHDILTGVQTDKLKAP